ncbi:MAG: alpha/beta fold hydrolase [Polymorphobacter sp.]|uniref:alpha/beta fold hydrolase n=1 Tax=Polymorphobacter sp. TaxID=1909290 RepID=UPI003A8B02B5
MRRYVEGRWGQVHVEESGDGPALVLLHQSPLSGRQFAPALPLLAQNFRVIAPDTPGFGASDAPPAPASINDHADALAGVLDGMGLARVHLLGHHTGAAIAAAFAARHPERVDRLILNGVPLLTDEERAHFRTFRFAPLVPRADGGHLVDAWNQRLAATPGWTDLGAMHRHLATMLANPARYFWLFEPVFAHDLAADLKVISAPTLIFSNSGEDLFEASKRAQAMRPDWGFAALEGGTHDIVDEQPEGWARVVSEFLR